jgi:hypothetical protein
MRRALLSPDTCVPVLLLSIACCALMGVLVMQQRLSGEGFLGGVFQSINGRLVSLESRLFSLHANMDLQHQFAVSRADEEADTRARIERLQQTLSAILEKMHSGNPQHAGREGASTEAEEESDSGVLVSADENEG